MGDDRAFKLALTIPDDNQVFCGPAFALGCAPRGDSAGRLSSVVHAGSPVPVNAARVRKMIVSKRAGRSLALAALALFVGSKGLQNASANGDTRTISMRHIHTGESLTITYKKDGRYDEAALEKLNWLLRDWRRNEQIRMDPATIDIVWEVYREVGGKDAIEIICGYRAPATNSMLRRRSRGVAQFSQHTLGKAIDYYIPGVPLEEQREAGLRLQRGGVGYYPSSGSPFVHMDTGNVRHWPRMPEELYARVLRSAPKVQVASAGKPKKNILTAMFSPSSDEDDDGESTAKTVAADKTAAADKASTDKAMPTRVAFVPVPNARPSSAVAADKPPASYTVASADSRSVPAPAPARPAQAASLFAAASNADVISARGYWDAAAPEEKPAAKPRGGAQVASIGPLPASAAREAAAPQRETTGSLAPGSASWPFRSGVTDRIPSDLALSYAAENSRNAQAAREPVGHALFQNASLPAPSVQPSSVQAPSVQAAPAQTLPQASNAARVSNVRASESQGPTTVIEKAAAPGAASQSTIMAANARRPTPGAKFDDPWMRAAMWAPSIANAMTAATIGDLDLGDLSSLMRKPTASVMMTFTSDPHHGMTTDHFTGGAVVFLSTVTFGTRNTASLR